MGNVLLLIAFFMQNMGNFRGIENFSLGGFALSVDSKNYNYSNTKNCDYIYDFLHTDTNASDTLRNIHKTQAYNTIRIVWENSCVFSNATQNTFMESFSNIFTNIFMDMQANAFSRSTQLRKMALNRARQYLLSLENLENYRYDSGLQLAIALSYFLENQAQLDKMKFHMQKWLDLGGEIPKNLVKMTDYEDSLRTINRICKSVTLCDRASFQHFGLQ